MSSCPFTKALEVATIFGAAAVALHLARKIRAKALKVPLALPEIDAELSQRLLVACDCALAAGAAIVAAIRAEKRITSKGPNDLVTETDKANEKLIFSRLREAFSGDVLIGEESSSEAGSIAELTDAPTWIVDPIDGTTNFVHGLPLTCVSIGFALGGKVRIGVVYDPCAEEMFVAVDGHGAYLNGERVYASGCKDMGKAIVVQEYGYQREQEAISRMVGATTSVLSKVRGMRQLGSGAIDLVWVGSGRIDAVFSGLAGEGWQPWDYAAGWVFALEAGATMQCLDGSPFHLRAPSIVCAATPELAADLVAASKQHLQSQN